VITKEVAYPQRIKNNLRGEIEISLLITYTSMLHLYILIKLHAVSRSN